jgi:hypothetical protein
VVEEDNGVADEEETLKDPDRNKRAAQIDDLADIKRLVENLTDDD